MAVTIGALAERAPGEKRVSLSPEVAEKFAAAGARILIERGAGTSAQFPDASFQRVEWCDPTDVYKRQVSTPGPVGIVVMMWPSRALRTTTVGEGSR